MKEDFVSYDIAVKLRKKGFNIDTDFCYNQDGGIVRVGTCPAPQIHEVLKWLREGKKIFILIDIRRDLSWIYEIWGIEISLLPLGNAPCQKHQSYEQAALAGIEYVIDNLI